MNKKTIFLSLSLLLLSGIPALSQGIIRVTPEHEAAAAELVRQMTLDEKINYLGGYDGFYIRPVGRLGIPAIRMADGPQGIRNNTRSTLYPCGIAAAATWNPDLIYEMGTALGQDARARGIHILLGPGVNIYRSPLCGRNFEYMGEDPYLASRIAVNYIEGVQSQGVMATIKHFALNNQEYDRHHVSSDADERTMHEIYLPVFRAAVEEAGVGGVMTSYNLVNNVHAAENPYLLRKVLRESWGFKGMVMSDWTSTYSTLGTVKGGLDLEMPRASAMAADRLRPLVGNGIVLESEIDEKVTHILQTLLAFGFMDRPQLLPTISEDNPYSREVSYRIACESSVLLKNEGLLPLDKKQQKNLVLIGPMSDVIPCGGGSGRVDALHSVSLRTGLESEKGVRLHVIEDYDQLSSASEDAIRNASAVIVAVGFDKDTEKENSDRTFELPWNQNELIRRVASLNPNVAVVIYAGGNVEMESWIGKVPSVLMGWYPGQEGGLAIARMLTGKISPSGKLPVSFEKKLEDNPTHDSYYPEKPLTKRGFTNRYVSYDEGVFMGYRGYGKTGVQPMFPFGHGLTYTDFDYSGLEISVDESGATVAFTLQNTGDADAAETVQVYVGLRNSVVPRPAKELKAFQKVSLKKGESRKVSIFVPEEACSRHFSNLTHQWEPEGENALYDIYVGSSSEDIRLVKEGVRFQKL